MPSELKMAAPATPLQTALERRLHPLSWLFVLLGQLRRALLPLVILLVVGGRNDDYWELLIIVVVALAMAAYAMVYSFSFRYRLGSDALVIREGIIDRSERHVPFARIQNVSQRRNLLHRLFNVAELRVESAGGTQPEAKMSVVSVTDALAIEQVLRQRAPAGTTGAPAASAASGVEADSGEVLLRLPLGELVRLGLVSNRGTVAVAAALGVLYQTGRDPRDLAWVAPLWQAAERFMGQWIGGHGAWTLAFSALLLLLLITTVLRALSVVMAIVRHHGFRLELAAGRLISEEGLLTRVRPGAALSKIQRGLIESSLLMRWLGRESLRIDVAGGMVGSKETASTRFKWLAPLAKPAEVDALLARLLPRLNRQRSDWQCLHPHAWRRLAVAPSVLLLVVGSALFGVAQWQGWWDAGTARAAVWPLLWLALWALIVAHALGWARFTRYALDPQSLSFREGWLRRRWRMIETARIQAVAVRASPLDRWNGMARLCVEVAGGGYDGSSIEIPFLLAADAHALAAVLRRRAEDPRVFPAGQRAVELAGSDPTRVPLG